MVSSLLKHFGNRLLTRAAPKRMRLSLGNGG